MKPLFVTLTALGLLACGAAYILLTPGVRLPPRGVGTTMILIRSVGTAIILHRVQAGHLPSRLEDLIEGPTGDASWPGPYLKNTDFKDPWGNRILYTQTGSNSFELASSGADGTFGSEDDFRESFPTHKADGKQAGSY